MNFYLLGFQHLILADQTIFPAQLLEKGLLWDAILIWVNVALDAVISIAYFSIPIALLYFLLKRKDVKLRWSYVALAAIITCYGIAHLFEIISIWRSIYPYSTLLKVLTAFAATFTSVIIWSSLPSALALPSWRVLEEKNEELRKANEKYDVLFEESAVGFFEWRDFKDKNSIYWSRRLYQLFGLSRITYKPSVEGFLDLIHPDDHEKMYHVLKPDFENGEFRPIDFRVKINNEYKWFRSHRKVKYNDRGKPKFIVGSVENIHESRMAEEKLRHINQTLDEEVKRRTQQLEAANDAKSRFLAHMSHEIRTPLGLILGFSELLADDTALSNSARDYVQLITKNGEILSRVVNDLLDLSKVEAGKLRFSFIQTRIHDLLEEVKMAFEEKARKKGLEFEFHHSFTPEVEIVTDEIRLKQIMYNLISNAIKFTDTGKICIDCGILPDDNRSFYFDVVDSGLGISSEDRERVFLEFVQGSSAHNVSEFGSGLGLRLSRSLAQSLGGNVSLVGSKLNGGSHFRLTYSSQDQRSYGVVHKIDVSTMNRCALLGFGVHVLDDNEDNVRLAELFLKKLGCNVKGYTNPLTFIEDTVTAPPDLVLLDINMPEMSGFEVFDVLKTRGFQPPIWALTAHALNDDIQMILNRGFDAYILKPINLLTLRQKLVSGFSEVQYGQATS